MYEQRVDDWLDRTLTSDEKYAAVMGEEALAEAKAAQAEDRQQRRTAAERQLRAIEDEEG